MALLGTVHLWKDGPPPGWPWTRRETLCGAPQGNTSGQPGDRVILCDDCSRLSWEIGELQRAASVEEAR